MNQSHYPNEQPPLTKAKQIPVKISILQTILAVIALFTGAVALWAALDESDAVRKQQQAAVWPHLQLSVASINYPREESLTFSIKVSALHWLKAPVFLKTISKLQIGGKRQSC